MTEATQEAISEPGVLSRTWRVLLASPTGLIGFVLVALIVGSLHAELNGYTTPTRCLTYVGAVVVLLAALLLLPLAHARKMGLFGHAWCAALVLVPGAFLLGDLSNDDAQNAARLELIVSLNTPAAVLGALAVGVILVEIVERNQELAELDGRAVVLVEEAVEERDGVAVLRAEVDVERLLDKCIDLGSIGDCNNPKL